MEPMKEVKKMKAQASETVSSNGMEWEHRKEKPTG